MAVTKRIVCLANSRKLNGRCIAGRELVKGKPGDWIRPVSDREHEEVSERERQYEDGSDPKVLDIVDVPLLKAKPKGYQQENWLLDPAKYWAKSGQVTASDLQKLIDPAGALWTNGHSTYNGLNDTIPLTVAKKLKDSLRLVRVNKLTLSVFKPGEAFGDPKRRVQARFRHADADYRLWVTDPIYEKKYLAKEDGEHRLGDSYLTISLGEPYKDACYKLVAAIIESKNVK
jgi:hypothetical protein